MFSCCFPRTPALEVAAPLPGNWNSLSELAAELTQGQRRLEEWSASTAAIRAFILTQGDNLNGLDDFLKQIIAYGIEQDVNHTLTFVTNILDLNLLENILRGRGVASSSSNTNTQPFFQNALQWAREQQPLCPNPTQLTAQGGGQTLWQHWGPLVVYFVPNLINIFLGAFDFLDTQKKYTTLWDKYLLIEIIYKFFIIPSCLIRILKPVYGTSIKVYFVAGMIIASLAVFLACYKRWLKPLPPEVVNCRNLNSSINAGERAPIQGQTEPMRKLIEALLGGSNVLLVGRSGEGKTALVHHLVQRQRAGNLPHGLQNKTTFKFDCGMINSNGTFGYSELMNQTFEQIDGNADRVIFVLDEFSQIISKEMAFRAIKDRFLKDKPPFNFIAALTIEEFARLDECDQDFSFRREMTTIVVDSSTDERQLQLILHGLIERLAPDLPIQEGVFEAIIECSKDTRFLPNIGRPAKIEKILREAIGRCRYVYHPDYIPTDLNHPDYMPTDLSQSNLNQMHQQRNLLQREHRFKDFRQPSQELINLTGRISYLESKLPDIKGHIDKVHSIYRSHQEMRENYIRMTHTLASHPPVAADHRDGALFESNQITYLLTTFYLFDILKATLEREITAIPKSIPIQISVELIRQVCDDLCSQEGVLHGSTQRGVVSSSS